MALIRRAPVAVSAALTGRLVPFSTREMPATGAEAVSVRGALSTAGIVALPDPPGAFAGRVIFAAFAVFTASAVFAEPDIAGLPEGSAVSEAFAVFAVLIVLLGLLSFVVITTTPEDFEDWTRSSDFSAQIKKCSMEIISILQRDPGPHHVESALQKSALQIGEQVRRVLDADLQRRGSFG